MEGTFNWKGPHRSEDRTILMKKIPDYTRVMSEIESCSASKEQKCLFSIMLLTTARVSEACAVKAEHITITLNGGYKINYHNSKGYTMDPRSNIYIDIFDISGITVLLTNLKNKSQHLKTIPVDRNDTFAPGIMMILDRMREVKSPDELLYKGTRQTAWWAIKKYLGDVVQFPHHLRHIAISNLVIKGLGAPIIKEIAGWSNLQPFSTYAHLNSDHIASKLKEVFGDNLEKLNNDNKPLSLNQVNAAYLAAAEKRTCRVETIPKDDHYGRSQIAKASVVADRNNIDRTIVTNTYIRSLRDKLADTHKPVVKKPVVIEEDILQVV